VKMSGWTLFLSMGAAQSRTILPPFDDFRAIVSDERRVMWKVGGLQHGFDGVGVDTLEWFSY
jgi:hypothetical protein